MTRWGGGVSPSQKTVKLGENYGDLPTPTRTGYTFGGWKTPSGSIVASTTQNTIIGNHTLTAQWTPNNYKIIYYENKNILDGGEFHEAKDITQNEWDNYGSGASIVTADGLACAKISGALATIKYIGQTVLSKIKFNTEYIVSIKTKVVGYTAGTTNPYLALYMDGSYNNNGTSTWYSLMGGHSLGQYSGQGWKEVFYHTTSNFTVTSSTATNAIAFVYARDFTGDIYFRDYSIAEATNTSRTVTFDKSPGAASVLSYNGYDFQGYYTQPVGGTKIYNADGSVVKGVSGYTDSNGNWIRSTETKLYGQWKGWAYLPDSAGATFVNTQALQNSSGGRGKRVVQINTTNNASGTARTYKYSWDGSTWSNGASLVTKTSTGDQTLYVRVYPTGGEHYRGYVQTSIVVHLNKLPVPYTYAIVKKTGSNGYLECHSKRMVSNSTLYTRTWKDGDSVPGYSAFTDDSTHGLSWNGWIIVMTNNYCTQAYHALNGFVDSDVQTQWATASSSSYDGAMGTQTYHYAQDDGTLTT